MLPQPTTEGLFMTHSGSVEVIIAVNRGGTNRCHCTHISFDEAHMSSTQKQMPPMGIVLQNVGFQSPKPKNPISLNTTVKIKLLSPHETM